MTKKSTIQNKISLIEGYLEVLGSLKKHSREEIEKDIYVQGTVERYLYLACQATIDLAEAVVSAKDFRKPTTMTESFYILNENEIINLELTEKLSNMVGFRNIIAHEYEKVNYKIVHDVLQNGLSDIKKFLEIIEGL